MSTRRSDSPAFDRPDGGSSYQPKTPGTTFRPAHTPVGSKVWGRPFQRAAGPGRRPGRPSQRAKLLIRSEHFSLLLSFCDRKRKEKPARPAPSYPANTPQWGVLQPQPPSNGPALWAGPFDPLKAAPRRPFPILRLKNSPPIPAPKTIITIPLSICNTLCI